MERDVKLKKLEDTFGTPMYQYHKNIIVDHYEKLSERLIPGARLYYSIKANPLLGVCQILAEQGAGIEVASEGELSIALQAGVSPSRIIFTSPGKTKAELRRAVEEEIKIINVDSLEEISYLDDLGKEKDKKIPIAIRINPSACFSNAKIKMTGVASQFGVDEDKLDDFLGKAMDFQFVDIQGFQVYMGTQMLLAQDIEANTDYAMNLFVNTSKKYGISLKTVNFGGGFGIKYFENEKDLDLEALGEGMNRVFEKYKDEFKDLDVIFESGRYLMAEAGEFITKVLYVRESKGTKYVVCDGGSNLHSSAAFMGRFVRNNFPITSVPDGEKEKVNVVGPLCTPLDVLGQGVMISKDIKPGDYIVVEKSGTYGLTYSMMGFLSHDVPVEIIEDDDKYAILRNKVFGSKQWMTEKINADSWKEI